MTVGTSTPLWQAAARTFEELALLFPDATLTPAQADAPLAAQAVVEFTGPMRGRLALRVTADVLPAAAANMLGDIADDQPPLQRDALGELANVVCGNLLPAIAGAEAVFQLAAPRVGEVTAAVVRAGDPGHAVHARAVLGVEHGRAEVELWIVAGAEHLRVPLGDG